MMNKFCIGLALLLMGTQTYAQNTGGVFPPMVNEGHKSFQYRAVVNPDNSEGKVGFAQRAHYEEALDGDRMWRIIGQTRKTAESDFDFDFVQAELFWELSGDDPNYRTGFRFDARVRDGDRPNQIGANWMNQFYFYDGWSARALFLTTYQFGDNAKSGLNLQTRWMVGKSFENGYTVGVEIFNDYGNTENIESFEKQNHTVGPIFITDISPTWSLFSGVLFGVSDAAPDTEIRLWLTRPM